MRKKVEAVFKKHDLVSDQDMPKPSLCSIFQRAPNEDNERVPVFNHSASKGDRGVRRPADTTNGMRVLATLMLQKIDQLEKWRLLTFEEAIVGTGLLNRMNHQTSAGWPWIRKRGLDGKKQIFSFSPEGELVKGPLWDLCKQRTESYVRQLLAGEQISTVEMSVPKAELLPRKKLWRTRFISVLDVSWTIAIRMVMGIDLHNFLVCCKYDFPGVIGINVRGPEGTLLILKHTKIGQHHGCLDVKNFDGSHSLEEHQLAWRVFGIVQEELGLSKEENELRHSLAYECLRASMQCRNLIGAAVSFKNNGLSSGAPWTTIINTEVLVMIVYDAVIRWILKTFPGINYLQMLELLKENFVCSALGDDLWFTFSDFFKSLGFTSRVISEFFESTGRTVTSGLTKESGIPTSVSLAQVNFLSMSVKSHPEVPMPFLSLKPESTLGMLAYVRETELSYEEQLKSNVYSALLEVCWDEDLYIDLYKILLRSGFEFVVPSITDTREVWLALWQRDLNREEVVSPVALDVLEAFRSQEWESFGQPTQI